MTTSEKPNGIAAAAVLASAVGPLMLAVSHIYAEVSESAKAWVHGWGKAWMPGAEGIGPYSGKETLALLAWILSWVALHMALRRKNVNLTAAGMVFLIGIGVATTLMWPPITEKVVHFFQGGAR